MSRPLIGITVHRRNTDVKNKRVLAIRPPYTDAIHRAGGLVVLLPLGQPLDVLRELYERLDGIVLSGGGDVHPAQFDGQMTPAVKEVDEDRDQIELSLARWALAERKPFLGICRGVQVMNVALGGSLLIDIASDRPAAERHSFYPDLPWNLLAHAVEIVPNSRLSRAIGMTRVEVNSLHHQACDVIGDGLRVVACAPDGIVEGLEVDDEAHPFGMGVQWHPEWLSERPETRQLFSAFVAAAHNGR